MQDVIAQVLVIMRSAWRYRWLAVAVAWLVAVLGWVAVQFIPDKYESRTQVYVDTESLLRPLLSGLAVNRDVMSEVAMMQAVMLSRPNLEKVAQKTDLLIGAATPRQHEALIDSLVGRIQLGRPSGPGTQNTFVVSFSDPSPAVAHRVVRTLLDTFMEDSLGLKRSDVGVAQRFLGSQVKEYEQRLTDSEQRLAQFKQQNVGLLPGSGGGYYERLETELQKLQGLQQRYTELSQRRDELQRQLQGEVPTFGLMGDAEATPIDSQIARFKAQRDQLLLQYTEKHPQVQALNETIARLEAEKRAGAKISTSVAPPGGQITGEQVLVRSLDVNPVYQNLRLSMSQAEADLAALKGQLAAQQSVVANLRSQVNAIPEVEAELTRLNRDYEVNKQQYDALLKRLEQARLSEDAEQNTENVRFRVIEPPTKPVKPTGPKRGLLDSMILLVALAGGAGLAVLLAQLHPVFTSRDLLQKVTGIRVLGSVTTAVRSGVVPWYRTQSALVGGALAMLFVTYVLNQLLSDPIRAVVQHVTS